MCKYNVFCVRKFIVILQDLKVITLSSGKTFYMYKKYTYGFWFNTQSVQRWRCSSGCKAYLIVTWNGELIKAVGDHTHPAPQFCLASDGTYIRRRSRTEKNDC